MHSDPMEIADSPRMTGIGARIRTSRPEAMSVAVGAVFLFAFLGFFGVSADNTQYLLGASERVDPEFLRNDWFVQSTESFHPFFEIYMAWWLERDQLLAGLLLWYIFNLLWLCAAIVTLLKYLGVRDHLPLGMVLVVAMLLVGVRHGWGMYEIITGQALPAYLGYPPALLSVVFLFQRRFLLSAAAVAVTALIHAGLGALLVLCMSGPILLTMPRTRRELTQAGLGAGLVLIVFLPVVVGTVDKDASRASDLAILFYGRAPQHYAVQFSDLQTHLSGLHIFATSMILTFTIQASEIRLKVLSLIGAIGALCVLGYVLLSVWYVPTFVRLFPYRAIPLVVVVNCCLIASVLLREASSRRDLAAATLVALSSICFAYSLVASFVLLAGGALIMLLTPTGRAADKLEGRFAVSIACVAGAISLIYTIASQPPVYFPEWPPATQRVLASALAEHTPKDAVILVPPWLTGARLTTQRAIVVNTKNFPVYAPEMVQWADRMQAVSGIDPRQAESYLADGANIWHLYDSGHHARKLADLAVAARRYAAGFILVSVNSRFHWEAAQSGLAPIWMGSGFALYETPDGIS